MQEFTRTAADAQQSKTRADASLLEAWRVSARGPDNQIFSWLTQGAPAGILHQPVDVGIFPDCSAPSDNLPASLHSDWQQFQNYPGVEDQEITENELQGHLDKGHMASFDSHARLA